MFGCVELRSVMRASDPCGGDEDEPVTPAAKESHGEPAPAAEALEQAPANVGPGR